jgi:hypothetical protein
MGEPKVGKTETYRRAAAQRDSLERLDRIIAFHDAIASLFSEDFVSDLQNIRNVLAGEQSS